MPPRPLALAAIPLLAACTHAPVARFRATETGSPRIASPRVQSVTADVPTPIAVSTRVTHDAAIASLDGAHACFAVTLRATTGESTRIHRPAAWSPRLEIERRRSELEVEPVSVRMLRVDDEEVRAVRLVRNSEPRSCGASAWSTLAPLTPLLFVATVPSLVWLASEMPRHERICRASERTHLEIDDDSEIESVSAEFCFATNALSNSPDAIELRVSDPIRDDSSVRFRWQIAH